ncbi:MAG: hypothetical protein ACWGSD_20615, partial [Thermodesulfobacteriota bacterium]
MMRHIRITGREGIFCSMARKPATSSSYFLGCGSLSWRRVRTRSTSGPRETSFALHYFPELCEMWRLDDWENGVIIPKELQEYMDPEREDYELVNQIFNASIGPDTHDITRNGQYATSDPRKGNPEEGAAM